MCSRVCCRVHSQERLPAPAGSRLCGASGRAAPHPPCVPGPGPAPRVCLGGTPWGSVRCDTDTEAGVPSERPIWGALGGPHVGAAEVTRPASAPVTDTRGVALRHCGLESGLRRETPRPQAGGPREQSPTVLVRTVTDPLPDPGPPCPRAPVLQGVP